MAKMKKTKVMGSCAPMCSPESAPRLYLSLHDQQVAQIKGLTIGEEVTLHITGKVVGLSQREHQDHMDEKKKVKTGDIDLENYTVDVMGEEDNEYKKMADEDD